ncbi:MAG: S8 family serine peptidase, partial [Bacteroidota bacterium]
IQNTANKFNASLIKSRELTTTYEIANIDDALRFANTIEESGKVAWATPDFYAPIVLDNDPKYGEQFQLNNTGQTIDGVAGVNDIDVDAPEAWTISKGASSIIVAVMDDGVEAHEDLVDASGASRVLNGSTPNGGGNGAPGADGDHGQAVAGIIAASHNNIGVRGLAPEVKILPVNILNGSTTQQIAEGYDFARNNGADVLSSSWSYQSCTANYSNINQAISDLATLGRNGKGSFMAFTAGNNGRGNCINYPARLSNVYAVGAVTQIGEHASYSNQGPNIDIVAPSRAASTQSGAGVRTTDRMGSAGYSAGNYTDNFGGTSAACPVVSGTVALILSVNPNLTKSEVQNILATTADDMGTPGLDNTYGYGRVNAHKAVLAAGSPPDPTCTDGVQNGDETGVDCGGSSCPDCPITYCSASASNSNYEYIQSVQVGTINNVSGNNSGYADFTNLNTDLDQGTSNAITLTPGFPNTAYNEFWKVWIDFNKDGDFEDAGELVFEGTNGSNAITGTVTVGSSISLGQTRMRISMKWDAYPTGPCEMFQYGEIEDYTITITSGTTSSCDDGIQNGNETGVDCGGPDCAPCATCDDGIQNGNETGVDCGGPDCAPCATCDDGIQNGNETGVDCGGPDCPPCAACDDGIQNGNETGVDCGGPDCAACPTCDDGIQNGNETGVDCGGPDCAPCNTAQSGPPQSTPVSFPFCMPSSHVAVLHGAQSGPPQSTPVSFPF